MTTINFNSAALAPTTYTTTHRVASTNGNAAAGASQSGGPDQATKCKMMQQAVQPMMMDLMSLMSGIHGSKGAAAPSGGAGLESGGVAAPEAAHKTKPAPAKSSNQPLHISNPTQFANGLLKDMHDPDSKANVSSLVDWEHREGGNWNNTARYNPLNTTTSEPGATNMNSDGVKAYTSWKQGVQATASTLENGYYGDLLGALKSGKGLADGSYHGLSTWSGGAYASV